MHFLSLKLGRGTMGSGLTRGVGTRFDFCV